MLVLGITYGALIGLLSNYLVFWRIGRNRRQGKEPLQGLGAFFFLRYLMVATAIWLFWWGFRDTAALTAVVLSDTLVVKISIIKYSGWKGGRIE